MEEMQKDNIPVEEANMDLPGLDLSGQFAQIRRLMHRYQHYIHKTYGPMGDPYRGQGRILALLKMQPHISQKELSYLLDIRPQSLGELLAKLERSGYITRTPSENDRRLMDIHLTDEGARAADEKSNIGTLFDCLNAGEKETLSGYLERIIAALENRLDDGQDGSEQSWRDEGGRQRHGRCGHHRDRRMGRPERERHGEMHMSWGPGCMHGRHFQGTPSARFP